ncbi:unnamed protein product [Didymodactylos carnosus]|uniref:Uncharacterized protein n=1 Tax=Didymodactylos carnosus TaxID=1234261 RepID=A0A814JX84_9BILA|nr:unnamed protein product [Didymodactylos carnosus]CAF1043779.1 unnamed protein product [Didymodactylos carnosus]CAF3723263.1 unnamed protein product [Didymodactylos carnosus]CAF3813834.1 unnamed protein product [Didymodactylos carnosus]
MPWSPKEVENYKKKIPVVLHMKLQIADVLLTKIISLVSTTNTLAERNQHLQNVLTFLRQRAKDTETNHKFLLTKKNEIEVSGRLNAHMHERFLRDIPLYAFMNDNHKTVFIKKLCGAFFDIMKLYNITDIYHQHVNNQLIGAKDIRIYSEAMLSASSEYIYIFMCWAQSCVRIASRI